MLKKISIYNIYYLFLLKTFSTYLIYFAFFVVLPYTFNIPISVFQAASIGNMTTLQWHLGYYILNL